MKSRPVIRNSKPAPRSNSAALYAGLFLALALCSALAIYFFHSKGWILYYGDAEAHLNTARRIVDNQTPGYDQIGTVWLPLMHFLMLPACSCAPPPAASSAPTKPGSPPRRSSP
jgi:hypothetical protein